MSVHRLDILEGLPNPVFDALLEMAYKAACMRKEGSCRVETYKLKHEERLHYAIHYEVYGEQSQRVPKHTEPFATELLAWQAAFASLAE